MGSPREVSGKTQAAVGGMVQVNEPNLYTPPTGAWLYVMMTAADYNRFKVGKSINDPLDRRGTFRTADPFLALQGAFFIPAQMVDISTIEAYVKRNFRKRGLGIDHYTESTSEWFRGSGAWAIEQIVELLCNYTGQKEIGWGYEIHQDRITLLYEEALGFLFNRSYW